MIRVIGHGALRRRFAEALTAGRLHHAWLLHGPRGIGKRRLALVLAMRVLCERPDGEEPCFECHACRMSEAGAHPDLLIVEREEKRRDVRIDQVRELLSFLSLSGAESERRVVVLDDAERLNAQAANALLKGLEEPAPGSLLLMVCADAMRLPATVRSRCLMAHCPPLSEPESRQVLIELGVDEAHLAFALRHAEGCPGIMAPLADPAVAEALSAWEKMCAELARADVAGIEAWIREHLPRLPHDLVARIAGRVLLDQAASGAFAGRAEAAYEALGGLMRWPAEVQRHSLRPATSLFAAVLNMRAALRS